MSKASIDYDSFSIVELQTVANDFIEDTIKSSRKLHGGYSGSNYAVTCESGNVYVLKLCNGYSEEDVEAQARIQSHLRHNGLNGGCYALPRIDTPHSFVSCALGKPAVLLTFMAGKNADIVLANATGDDRAKKLFQERAFRSIGRGLALLHCVSCEGAHGLRTYLDGGVCDVRNHIDGSCKKKMQECVHTAKHPFLLGAYERELANLQDNMKAAEKGLIPSGILHGDPFLDNCLIDPQGDFVAWVDYEDVAVGPLLFDVACCVIGSCFSSDNSLNMSQVEAFLHGYCCTRPITNMEAKLFVNFMRLTLLCNCAWRFVNFHIEHREIEEARDSYKELSDRIEDLHNPETVDKIQAIITRCRSVNQRRRQRRFLWLTSSVALALASLWS